VSVCKKLEKLVQTQHKYGIDDDNVYRLGEGEFVMPGFIDTHIHAPQYPNSGLGYDKQLLDWLMTYTFPLEQKYTDVDFAIKVYESVVVS
jgi:guanine deaminase